jgi:hypothetical protein
MYMQINPQEDLVIYKENGVIMSGGYSIDSVLLKNNISDQLGGSMDNEFTDLAVPIGLLYIAQPCKKMDTVKIESHDSIPDDIYDRLFEMAQVKSKTNEKKKKTYKMKSEKTTSKRKTKKNKKSSE